MKNTKKVQSLKALKATLAAYISETSKLGGTKLTAPQIQSLFDDTAKLKDPSTLQDKDIESPEAFAKSIQRKAPLYKDLFKLDKN